MDGLLWKSLLKWMIWGENHYFWKHPAIQGKSLKITNVWHQLSEDALEVLRAQLYRFVNLGTSDDLPKTPLKRPNWFTKLLEAHDPNIRNVGRKS